ncbi:MAG: zinc-ribbon domain-containing protein [Candidatus Bathyarchaeota archaeon]
MSKTKQKKEEKPVKIEKVAEDTGKLIGKGVRKSWDVAKSFGKGLIDAVDKREDRKDTLLLSCSHCGTSLPPNSKFCTSCRKRQ